MSPLWPPLNLIWGLVYIDGSHFDELESHLYLKLFENPTVKRCWRWSLKIVTIYFVLASIYMPFFCTKGRTYFSFFLNLGNIVLVLSNRTEEEMWEILELLSSRLKRIEAAISFLLESSFQVRTISTFKPSPCVSKIAI